MVSILPSERSPLDVLGRELGRSLSSVIPQGFQQGYQRGQGLSAIDQAQSDIKRLTAGGQSPSPTDLALSLSKIAVTNPDAARALGPMYQTLINKAIAGNVFPPSPGGTPPPSGEPMQPGGPTAVSGPSPNQPGTGSQPTQKFPGIEPQVQPSKYATPGPFNLMTPAEIDAESKDYQRRTGDPNGYTLRQSQLQKQNEIANQQRETLEDFALKADIPASELPRFMVVGSKFDTKNPSEWAQETKRAYAEVKNNDDKIKKAFIPGLGSGLLGRNRGEALKKLEPTVQDQVSHGLEQETRKILADNYLTPTEIEQLIHPLSDKLNSAVKKLPRSIFPEEAQAELVGFPSKKPTGFISYEEALLKAPEEMKSQQDRLAKFFKDNVDSKTSLLALRQPLLKDRHYDWRQIGPAIRQAEKMGLKLEPFQSTELADIETQAPYDSLPNIFQDWDRVVQYLRGGI